MEYLFTGKVDTGYEWQCQYCMFVTDRKWWDYFVYNPNFIEREFIIRRIYRDESAIEKIKVGVENGKLMINEMLEKLK